MKGTIEERIYERQIFKLLLSNRILQNPKQKALFCKMDFKELFELRDTEDESAELPESGAVEMRKSRRGEPLNSDDSSKDLKVLQALFDGADVCSVYDHNYLENNIISSIISDANVLAAQDIVRKATSRLSASKSISDDGSTSMQYSVLERLRVIFETEKSLTSQEILQRFGDIDREYAPIFREMLRRVATLRNNIWTRIQ